MVCCEKSSPTGHACLGYPMYSVRRVSTERKIRRIAAAASATFAEQVDHPVLLVLGQLASLLYQGEVLHQLFDLTALVVVLEGTIGHSVGGLTLNGVDALVITNLLPRVEAMAFLVVEASYPRGPKRAPRASQGDCP